jgi:hypothetical protein
MTVLQWTAYRVGRIIVQSTLYHSVNDLQLLPAAVSCSYLGLEQAQAPAVVKQTEVFVQRSGDITGRMRAGKKTQRR